MRGLLEEPARLVAQFRAFAQAAVEGDEHEQAERRTLLAQRRRGLVDQQAQWDHLCQERLHAQEVLGSLAAGCQRHF